MTTTSNLIGILFSIFAISIFVIFGYYFIMFNFFGFKLLKYGAKKYKNTATLFDWFKSFSRLAILMKAETRDNNFKQLQEKTRFYFFRMLIVIGLAVLIFVIFAIIIVSLRL